MERLPTSGRARLFFETLAKKKVLYVIQEKDGPILPTDIVCVFAYNSEDETPDKVSLTVEDFYRYTATDPSIQEDLGEYIMNYAAAHKYMIQTEDEDPDDFDNIEYKTLREVPNFSPEAIPMTSLDPDNGYDYEVIDDLSELHISSTSFVQDEKYIPPLLFLLIEALHELDLDDTEWAQIQIARYGSGTGKSVIIITNYQELIDLVDSAILRSYTLLPAKYNTPESRIQYIRDTLVKSRLDPKNLRGWYIPRDE